MNNKLDFLTLEKSELVTNIYLMSGFESVLRLIEEDAFIQELRGKVAQSASLTNKITNRIMEVLNEDIHPERMNPNDAIILCYLVAIADGFDSSSLILLQQVEHTPNLYWSAFFAREKISDIQSSLQATD